MGHNDDLIRSAAVFRSGPDNDFVSVATEVLTAGQPIEAADLETGAAIWIRPEDLDWSRPIEPQILEILDLYPDGTGRLHAVGILADGSLHNPNNYDPELVRAAVLAAQERRRLRRSEAAIRAARTREGRKARLVYEVAKRIVAGSKAGPRDHCVICGKGLGDPESRSRGIGAECWQRVLGAIMRVRLEAAR
jgi:hypothetical protein